MTSFFGGNPNMSHFTANRPYITHEESYKSDDKNARRKAPDRRRDQSAKLKEAGFKQRYFQFRNSDEAGKAAAKAACEAHAAEWEAKVGFKLDVCEGSFL